MIPLPKVYVQFLSFIIMKKMLTDTLFHKLSTVLCTQDNIVCDI